jgi:phosphoglycerate dehydrogenase-like enzyme
MKVGVPIGLMCQNPVLREELLSSYPDAKLNDQLGIMSEDEMIEFLGDCDAAIVGREPVNDKVLSALPNLRVIGKFGVGCEDVDFDALRRHGVCFGYLPGVNKLSVAELALNFAISGLRGVSAVSSAMRAGERPRQNLGRLLSGRTFGIHELVRLLAPFQCILLACDVDDYPDFYATHGATPVGFDELVDRAEVISIHLPLTSLTRSLYNDATLGRLKPDCILINTSRGFIVDEVALKNWLRVNPQAGACFDVFAIEPPVDDDLLRQPNFLSTPHIGASAVEARLAMGRAAIRGLTQNEVPGPEYDQYR